MLLFALLVAPVTPDTTASFSRTLSAAMTRHAASQKAVVHMVGTTDDVEGKVDWCSGSDAPEGSTLVLIGPQLSSYKASELSSACERKQITIRYVTGLYKSDTLQRSVVAGLIRHEEAKPDMVIVFNADAYTCPWRRTLVHLLTLEDDCPAVVLTTYEEHEAEIIQQAVVTPGSFFSKEAVLECDSIVHQLYPSAPMDTTVPAAVAPGVVHWPTEKNLMAHSNGRALDSEGRNTYWVSFGCTRKHVQDRQEQEL